MKKYKVQLSLYNKPTITEIEIERETKDSVWWKTGKKIIQIRKITQYDLILDSYKEAKQALIDHFNDKINTCKKTIEQQNDSINKIEKLIEETKEL